MEQAIDPDGNSSSTKPNQARRGRHYSEVALWKDVSPEQWADYRWHLKNCVTTLEQLEQVINLTAEEREGFLATRSEFAIAWPFRIVRSTATRWRWAVSISIGVTVSITSSTRKRFTGSSMHVARTTMHFLRSTLIGLIISHGNSARCVDS